jgi:acyl-CoA thioester hydrolase
MPKPISYQKTFCVSADVIDHFNHVNNLVYVKWVLDISKEHWNSFSPEAVRNEFGWMILKHELHYKGQAKLNDELLIETWIKDFSTARSHRKTIIKDRKTDKIILESLAEWCFVSLNTRKPTRLSTEILHPYFEDL